MSIGAFKNFAMTSFSNIGRQMTDYWTALERLFILRLNMKGVINVTNPN
jgi:hypothetical protein